MEIFHTDFRVISEIQRAKCGILLVYIFGGKIWGNDTNFRGKFCGQAPPNHLIWKSPLGTWDTRLGQAQDSEVKSITNQVPLSFSSAVIPHFDTLQSLSFFNVASIINAYGHIIFNYWSSSSQAVPFRDWESPHAWIWTKLRTLLQLVSFYIGSCRVKPLLRLSGENYNEEIS